MNMNKLIGWPVANLLYGLGHITSKLMHVECLGHLYPVYNWLMCRSLDVNDWAGLGLWGPALDRRDEHG